MFYVQKYLDFAVTNLDIKTCVGIGAIHLIPAKGLCTVPPAAVDMVMGAWPELLTVKLT